MERQCGKISPGWVSTANVGSDQAGDRVTSQGWVGWTAKV